MHVHRWKLRATLVLALVVASMPVSPALAIGTLDQEQPTIDSTVGGLAIGGTSQQKLGQTFTAGLTGTLTEIALPVACDAGATLAVEIRDVAGAGPGATVLASTSVPGASLPQFFPAPPAFRTISFPSGAAVTAGTSYALVLTAGDPGCGIFRGPVGDPYAAGDLYFDALPNAPGWVCVCDFANERRDLPFRTYVTVTPPATADLGLALTESSDPVFASFTSFSYTATATNFGSTTATGVVVRFTLPADLDLVFAPSTCTTALPTVSCSIGALVTGANGAATISVKVAAGRAPTTVTMAASVSAAEPDPDLSNNSTTETTTVRAVVDMELLTLTAPATVASGDQITYTVEVRNTPGSWTYPASNAGALVNLPSGATFVSVTSTTAGALCGLEPSGKYGCNFGTLASNATATMHFKVFAPSYPATLSLTAETVSAEPEIQPANDTKTIQVTTTGEQVSVSGGNATTDTEGCTPTGCDGATATDGIETTVNTTGTGPITITETSNPTTPPPSGYGLVGFEVTISAPPATATNPVTITFEIHSSFIPAGQTAATIQVFRNGTLVPSCANPAIQEANPDPCVWQRQAMANGNVRIAVLTSQASVWNFGFHLPFAFDGFFAPLAGQRSEARAGSTIPVKFSLGGDHGLAVIASATSNPCGSTAATPISMSALRYDASSDRYILNWRTDRTWAGCRELAVQLIDGSVHRARVHFR